MDNGKEKAHAKILSTCVDFFDYCFWSGGRFRERDVEALFADLAATGFCRVYWRVSSIGRLLYPTKAASMYVFDGRPESRWVVDTIQTYDMLATGAKYARKYGLTYIPWLTILDDDCTGFSRRDFQPNMAAGSCNTPLYNPFLTTHPHVQKKHLTRTEYMRGVMCYAEPEAVAFQQAVVDEIMAYDVDGILFSIHSHVNYRDNPERDLYGFNPPIITRYREWFDVDLTQHPEALDLEKALVVRASFWDEFLAGIGARVNRLKRKFIMMIEIPDAFKGGIWHDVNVKIGQYRWNWPTWVRAGTTESIIFNTVHGRWNEPLKAWIDSLEAEQPARFILSYNPLPDERIFQPAFGAEYRDFLVAALRDSPIAEVCCYETQHLSRHGNRLMRAVADAHEMLMAQGVLSA